MNALDVRGWSIEDHLAARRRGVTACESVDAVLRLFEELDDPAVLIGAPLRELAMAAAAAVDATDGDSLPLHGVPFVVKDNIDVAGAPTTCAYPPFEHVAKSDAAVVAALRRAGAIVVGKSNLDQFATGLVGVRSPYGTPRNPLDPSLVPGGSSSGSAVAVARGLVPFSLGTDTAGSGRVPAAMCRVVGLKPTVGRFPSEGMVPAVRRIDCPTVFARSVGEAALVANVAEMVVADDPYSRPRREGRPAVRTLGVLAEDAPVRSLMQPDALRAYESVVAAAVASGFAVVAVGLDDFLAAGRLLYGGAFVAERTAAVGSWFATDDSHEATAGADPTVRGIVTGGASKTAVDAYRSEYDLAALRSATASLWSVVDALLVPTTPGVVTLAEIAAEPITANSWIGTFTTSTNLLDLAAISVPCGVRGDGMPSGVQLIGPAWSDAALADAAARLLREPVLADAGALRPGEIGVVVVGAHLSAMALNHQLTSRSARLVRATETAPSYRLYALDGTVPPKPGLRRVTDDGASIAVELWALGASAFASFVAEIPPPLGIGSLELADGTWCKGFVCEPYALDAATDITSFGGWRAYIASISTSGRPAASDVAGARIGP